MGGGTRLFCKASPKLHAMWLLWSGCDTSKHLYWQLSQAFILCLLSFWPWNDAAKLMICFSSEILTLLTYWCYNWLHLRVHCSYNLLHRSVLWILWYNARWTFFLNLRCKRGCQFCSTPKLGSPKIKRNSETGLLWLKPDSWNHQLFQRDFQYPEYSSADSRKVGTIWKKKLKWWKVG